MAEETLTLTRTLNQLAELDAYNEWLFEQFAHCLGQRILEVGSGTGNITEFLRLDGRQVTATDVLPSYRRELHTRFSNATNVSVDTFDLTGPAPAEMTSRSFDTVVCLNVLEHIEDDQFALLQMRSVLARDGQLALLVPAHRLLYGEFDRAVGHYRRYERRGLKSLLEKCGFNILSLRSFSLAATLPWWINGRLLKRSYLPSSQTSLANRLVPLMRLERLIGPPFGLSLIAIAQKPQ